MGLRGTLSLVLTVLLAGAGQGAPRNVVLFVTDDLSPDLGCYGNKVIKTPNLDRLATEATRFTNAFCTTASCSASRSVILSGLHNHATGQYGHEHSFHHFRSFEALKTLPVLLGQAGYRTARIGKFHVGPEEVYHFQTALKGNARSPVEMANNCKTLITAKDERPFFLYFCTADPHRGGGQAQDLPGKPDRFGNRAQGYPGVKTITYDPKEVIVPPFLPDSGACRAELAQYYQSVSRVDQGLGRLVEILKEAGRWDDTLILFTSDHGIAFPGAKTTVYEPGLRIPLLARNPGVKTRGIVNEAMISLVDLTPTILDFAQALPARPVFHGRSFLSILEQTKPDGWDCVYCSHSFHEIQMYYPMRVVRERRYKLIWNIAHGLSFPFASDLWEAPTWQEALKGGKEALYGKRTIRAYLQRPAFELYDLQTDPDEIKNLADDPAQAKRLAALKEKLKAFQKQTKDGWLSKWEYE